MALIKCTECGQMISDKAFKCPKCGCPTKEETLLQHEDVDAARDTPVYNEGDGHSSKWLYGVIALLLAVIAGGGYWHYCHSKGDQEVQQFVEQFTKAVETGDSLIILNSYPDAADADSLFIPSNEYMVSKMNESNNYKVEWNKDIWMEISPQEKEGWKIISSQGIFAWQDDVMKFAKKTGQWKAGVTDKELSTRMNDMNFKTWIINDFAKYIKDNLKVKGKLRIVEESMYTFVMDGIVSATIENQTNSTISGKDYKVVFDGYFSVQGFFEEDEAIEQGKDIAPGETVSITTEYNDMHSRDRARVEMKLNNQEIFNKYFVAKGDEYDNYLISKNI